MGTWAGPSDIASVWRPLTPDEQTRANTLIDSVERAIKRTWPSELVRIGAKPLPPDGNGIDENDVKDVVVWSVLPLLGARTDLPSNAKSYQITSGAESRSVTLDGSAMGTFMTFLPWMVDVFEQAAPAATSTMPIPSGGSPASVLGEADWLTKEPGDPLPWWMR
jgi:hypothetical protein